jgi:hypothetical protein
VTARIAGDAQNRKFGEPYVVSLAALDEERPIEYGGNDAAGEIAFLTRFPRAEIASELGISERAWRSIAKGTSHPRVGTGERIAKLAGKGEEAHDRVMARSPRARHYRRERRDGAGPKRWAFHSLQMVAASRNRRCLYDTVEKMTWVVEPWVNDAHRSSLD